ncbi:MAG: hypothetical protein NVS1B6_03650 [Steroidobacteraceae bacterium]
MDIENNLRTLESAYRHALSGAVAAKACYLARSGQPNVTPATIERAKAVWRRLESRKAFLAAKMVELEEIERAAIV